MCNNLERRIAMSKLLPMLSELKPISGNRDVFGQTVFTKEFNLLNFEEKLQVACDMVRQTMYTVHTPNPENDRKTMMGDSYTACNVLKDYLIFNCIGEKHHVVFAKSNFFETERATTKHFILLVYDNNDVCYQVDPSPYVGYMCGKAEKLGTPWYKQYVIVKGDLKNKLELLRLLAYELKIGKITCIADWHIEEFAKRHPILKGYVDSILNRATNEDFQLIDSESFEYANKQISILSRELEILRTQEGTYKRQLEIIQWISSQKKKMGLEGEKYAIIFKEKYRIDELTPRFFYEHKLNLAMLKTSSFYIGKEEIFKELLCADHRHTGGYMVNLGESKSLGFSKMYIFHPDGYKYIRHLYGPNYMFLIQDHVEDILIRKRSIRINYSPDWGGRVVKWYDGKNIEWVPLAMNLVHSADNSAETCCNYQCGFPECQLMTRFVYPNPNLKY
jgi:hypothetical protein